MSKLVILSERNVLEFLRNEGVQPYEFYTDVNTFKKHMAMFEDITVLCLFTGTCNFSKKIVGELINTMEERANDSEDTGIVKIITLSDTVLPLCNDYYKYENTPKQCIRYFRKDLSKPLEKVDNIWKTLEYDKSQEIRGVYLQDEFSDETLRALKEKRIGFDSEASRITIPKIDIFDSEDNEETETYVDTQE